MALFDALLSKAIIVRNIFSKSMKYAEKVVLYPALANRNFTMTFYNVSNNKYFNISTIWAVNLLPDRPIHLTNLLTLDNLLLSRLTIKRIASRTHECRNVFGKFVKSILINSDDLS